LYHIPGITPSADIARLEKTVFHGTLIGRIFYDTMKIYSFPLILLVVTTIALPVGGVYQRGPFQQLAPAGVMSQGRIAGQNPELSQKLDDLFRRDRETEPSLSGSIMPLKVDGIEIPYAPQNRDYFTALLNMRIRDNRREKGIAEIGTYKIPGKGTIQSLLIRDTGGNKFIVLVKEEFVEEVALAVRPQTEGSAGSKGKFEFVVVDDSRLRIILQSKLREYRKDHNGLLVSEKFSPGGEAEVMTGLLTRDEVAHAKETILGDPLLTHLFEFTCDRLPKIAFRGFISVEIPIDQNGFYDGQRIAFRFGRGFRKGTAAHELTHHFFRQLEQAVLRVDQGIARAGDDQKIETFTKIMEHFQEDRHQKLFDYLRNNKIYGPRVRKSGVYLRDEALAFVVGTLFERQVVEFRSGYEITPRDVKFLVEIGLLPKELYGNEALFEGIALDVPLPGVFHSLAEFYDRRNDRGGLFDDPTVLQAAKQRIIDHETVNHEIGELLYMVQWLIWQEHFDEAEQLLDILGSDRKFKYPGKREEILLGKFLLAHSRPHTNPVGANRAFRLLSDQLRVRSSRDVFSKIFSDHRIDLEKLRLFLTEEADKSELRQVFSPLYDYLLSQRQQQGDLATPRGYELCRALGSVTWILGMEPIAKEFFAEAEQTRETLDTLENLIQRRTDFEEDIPPEQKRQRLMEAMEGKPRRRLDSSL